MTHRSTTANALTAPTRAAAAPFVVAITTGTGTTRLRVRTGVSR